MGRTGLGVLALAAISLGACSSFDFTKPPPPVAPNIFPSDYRNEILQTLSVKLTDPTNVRDAGISDPVLQQVSEQDQRYAVCVRFNARDINRQYTGDQERIAYFYGGHLNQLVPAANGQCKGAIYKPWPELEKNCQAKKCG
ncbi:MAG TPA: hypothetical protein VGV41_15260 [Pseudolabrys sp.]|jgi:hypothetical protein|uniref:hypothetical protein n=1 Tax=Pseudolabrys sp. TaxID=1960880 RepID=UPI002DDD1E29|nr:hypothetical protein [Pseudolabrys sp.]HEV2629991.1 hypothetical protein [Pseudolabrys sp.]